MDITDKSWTHLGQFWIWTKFFIIWVSLRRHRAPNLYQRHECNAPPTSGPVVARAAESRRGSRPSKIQEEVSRLGGLGRARRGAPTDRGQIAPAQTNCGGRHAGRGRETTMAPLELVVRVAHLNART